MSDTPPHSPPEDAADSATAGPTASGPPPALVAGFKGAVWLTADGELEAPSSQQIASWIAQTPPLVCHGPATARRLGLAALKGYDLLELFAFVRPGSFCAPTPRGLARKFSLPEPQDLEAQALVLLQVADLLLKEMATRQGKDRQALDLAFAMAQAGWLWGPVLLRALGFGPGSEQPTPREGYEVWRRLGEWQEMAPPPPPDHHPVSEEDARKRLASLLDDSAESRPEQADYAGQVAAAFRARQEEGAPNLVLAEAGTGVGKTLGYIAPASVWAEQNEAPIWLSTYTRNLQRQIDDELDKLFPQRKEKRRKVVVRKGRENYLCLLNYAEAARSLGGDWQGQGERAIALGLLARWVEASRDGDMVGGDFAGWLADLLGRSRTLGLTDRRGECIYSACEFYKNCFIEKSVRRAKRAQIVVANHALVMIQAALGASEEGGLPPHYVFDEGHHLFDAADGAFACHLSGYETRDLRRWLLGNEGGRRGAGASRVKGLKRRLEDFLDGEDELRANLDAVLRAARNLPGENWHTRLAEGRAEGPSEIFLLMVRQQVFARSQKAGEGYSLECPLYPVIDGLTDAAADLSKALDELLRPLQAVEKCLAQKLDQDADELDSDSRRRIESTLRALQRRASSQIQAWKDMLACLETETPPDYVDWLAVERSEGREIDIGYFRHHLDPTRPFAATVLAPAQGALVTSATLTDRSGEVAEDWQAAKTRSGALYLPQPAREVTVPSPFYYSQQTRIFVVNDVRKDDLDQVAAALRELFLASGGGGLGLFTAISRLKAVHRRIAVPLEDAGVDLHAQHIDGMDVSTLVEIFRAETHSCLLGTDAVRDGIDVPGESLRLIVFDRVPWPRPDLRHKARRNHFGKRHYDDMLTRFKLRQAYGRLIRRADDRGVFVLLDPMMPSRLATAFPEGVEVQRVGLAEAIAETRNFLGRNPAQAELADDDLPF
ncbi:ATP-dependent DNA helicase [Rhodovibrionaceae bacterium A322]